MFHDYDDILYCNPSMSACPKVGPFSYHNFHEDPEREELALQGFRRAARPETDLDARVMEATGELITEDPLNSSRAPGEDRRCWKLCLPPAVPRGVPKFDYKKGTTTLGFEFDGGIIIAVDSRASVGQYIGSQTVMKVVEINDYLLGTLAGGAADCQYWERVLAMECRLAELRNGQRVTVAAASKILANITYAYRNHGLSMGTMIAGWDQFGPSLYYVDDKGSRVKQNLFSVGSGSIYAYGVLDSGYKKNLTVPEACDLARRSIFHATYRDAGSGGIVTVYHVHQNGWTLISRDDQTELFNGYFGSQTQN